MQPKPSASDITLGLLPSIGHVGPRYAAAIERADEAEEKRPFKMHLLADKAPRNILSGVKFNGQDHQGCRYREVSLVKHHILWTNLNRMFRNISNEAGAIRFFEVKLGIRRPPTCFPYRDLIFSCNFKSKGKGRASKDSERNVNYGPDKFRVVDIQLPVISRNRRRAWVAAVKCEA